MRFGGLAKELRDRDVKVKMVKGWKKRGHPGSFAPRGVMFHHTASNRLSGNAPALGIVTHGRSDLPGPLCHFLVGRDGTVYFIAKGRAYHAGEGGPLKGVPADAGNTALFGIECENNGIGEPWPERQKQVIAILSAVLLDRMNAPTGMLVGHKEWTTRKIDPAGIDMDAFRHRVSKVLKRK